MIQAFIRAIGAEEQGARIIGEPSGARCNDIDYGSFLGETLDSNEFIQVVYALKTRKNK